MAFQNGNVKRPPIKNNANPINLKKTATITHTSISKKNFLNALRFNEIASKILLLLKNMSGATKMVTNTHITARIMV
jgi:hypothetical protein